MKGSKVLLPREFICLSLDGQADYLSLGARPKVKLPEKKIYGEKLPDKENSFKKLYEGFMGSRCLSRLEKIRSDDKLKAKSDKSEKGDHMVENVAENMELPLKYRR